MTSNRKAKKMSAMEAHRAVNRQFYRRQEVLDYPDIIHVKNDDPHRSDVVCFRTFGQAYMDVVPHPATTEDDYQTTQYIRPRMLAKAWRERIFDAIDRLKQDETLQFAGFGHEFDHCSVSQVIEGLYIAVGNMEEMLRELEQRSGPGGLNLSAHLCGSIARAAVRGDFDPFRDWARSFPFIFNRCQLNIATSKENPDSFKLCGNTLLFDEFILQQRSVDDCDLYLKSNTNEHVTMLLDASGGEGIDTALVAFAGKKIGYAGGINADNVADKLTFLMENEQVGDFWIDMESGVRTDDWFDLDKVRRVLEICEPIINKYK